MLLNQCYWGHGVENSEIEGLKVFEKGALKRDIWICLCDCGATILIPIRLDFGL